MNQVFIFCTWFILLFFGAASSGNFGKKGHLYDVHRRMSNIELKRYFGVSSLIHVPEYDITFPTNANERGKPISEHRAKRDVGGLGIKYFQLDAFGKNLHLNVTLNKHLLGPNFYIETRHENGSKTVTDAPHRNFYHGHVVSNPGSLVAISDNRGVSGAIRVTDDEMLFVQPLPRHLSGHDHNSKGSIPHLIVKRSANDFHDEHRQMFETEEYPQRDEERITERDATTTVESDEQGHRFLEVIYVGDYLITEHIGLIELPDMLLIIGNIVSRMFTDSTFGKIKLNYVVTKMIILNNDELNYVRNASNGKKLDVFGDWLNKNNPRSDKDPDHVDTGTLFTSYTGGGLALSGGMCYWNMKAVVGSIGLSSSVIAAHENFHNLGGGHDGVEGCPNGANIMSTYVPSGKAAFTWSNCSRKFVQNFLRSSNSFCLNDQPTLKRPSLPPLIRGKLPGVVFDADKQCEYKLSLGAKQCSVSCGHLFCSNPGGGCWSSGGAPADGTRCGDSKWCIRGECVDDGSPPVDGNWGSWSDFTACSRSCAVGVQHRSRKCDNPKPKGGGKPCPESSKEREYRTCNIHVVCPIESMSFREQQCKSKNVNYTDYIRSGAECYLWCSLRGAAYLHGQVIDGTRCYKDPNDICVRGECKTIGCDKQISGPKRNDRCNVCGGDGSSCELKITNYTKIHTIYGKENADTMLVLKKGWENVHAKMQGSTWNTIGIQDKNGEYIIKVPSWTTTVQRAGMSITFIHRRSRYNDEIIIRGTITEELRLVFIHIRSKNQGVVIRYYTPVDNITKPSQQMFYWKTGDWSACSKTCGHGQSARDVNCFRLDDHSRVGNAFCAEDKKPESEKSCKVRNCQAEWHTYMTKCSKTCGKGVQTRKIICRRKTVDESWVTVDNSECTGPRPTSTALPQQQVCNEIACDPEYVTEPWSPCSTTCGKGTLTRTLKCEIINNEGGTTALPISTCEHYNRPKPLTEKKCNYDKPCKPLPKFVGIGCFADKVDRALPVMLKNLRPQLDWRNPNATIQSCAILAQERQLGYFAIQYYGECWAPALGTVPKYDKYGPATNCRRGLGSHWSNYVYKITK